MEEDNKNISKNMTVKKFKHKKNIIFFIVILIIFLIFISTIFSIINMSSDRIVNVVII